VIFDHDSKLGTQPAHELFARVTVARAEGCPPDRPARRYEDYVVKVDGKVLDGVRRVVRVPTTED
jgi:CRISPR-associated protein Csd2